MHILVYITFNLNADVNLKYIGTILKYIVSYEQFLKKKVTH